MRRKLLKKGACFGIALLVALGNLSLTRASGSSFHPRTLHGNKSPGPPQSPLRYGYMPSPQNPTGGRVTSPKCIPHGLARCMGVQKKPRFYNRYAIPSSEESPKNPRFHYKYQHPKTM